MWFIDDKFTFWFLVGQVFSQWMMCTTWQMKFWRWNTLTIPMWWPWLVCVWALEVDQPLSCLIWKMEVSWAISGKTRRISSQVMTKTLTQWATYCYCHLLTNSASSFMYHENITRFKEPLWLVFVSYHVFRKKGCKTKSKFKVHRLVNSWVQHISPGKSKVVMCPFYASGWFEKPPEAEFSWEACSQTPSEFSWTIFLCFLQHWD